MAGVIDGVGNSEICCKAPVFGQALVALGELGQWPVPSEHAYRLIHATLRVSQVGYDPRCRSPRGLIRTKSVAFGGGGRHPFMENSHGKLDA